MPEIFYQLPIEDCVEGTCPVCKSDLSTNDSLLIPLKLYAKRNEKGNLVITVPEVIEDELIPTEIECAKCGEYV